MHLLMRASNTINFRGMLKLCRKIEDLNPLKCLLVVSGLIKDQYFTGQFIKSCFELGAPGTALSTFRRFKKPKLILQNVMVRSLCNHGLYDDLLSVYLSCRASGCPSDNFTFPSVIKASTALGALGIGKLIHCVVLRTGFEENVVVQTALVDFYAKCGHLDVARMVLDRIPQPDLVSWNALIAGLSSNGLDGNALGAFGHIHSMGLKPNVSTLASIIPVCSRSGCLDVGKCLHSFALKSGYFGSDFLVPALVSMYASDMDLASARNLFDSLVEKRVTVWNSMISAYTQNRNSFEALEIFQQMLRTNTRPNSVTFVSILPSCENSGGIWFGKSLHASLIKHESENQLSVSTALVSLYAKHGDISSAEFIFYQMSFKNLLAWNSMVSAYVRNGLWDVSLATFSEMQYAGFDPDAVSIISILSACSKLGAMQLGKSVHAFSVKRHLDSNHNVSNALLAFYSDHFQLSTSVKLLHKMAVRNVVSWNILISRCVHNGEIEKAASLLHWMQTEGVDLDSVTLISILLSYSGPNNLCLGRAVHGYGIKTGLASKTSLNNALISMYFNSGDADSGRLVFEIMPERSVVSWNAIITGYRYQNFQNKVLVLFSRMVKEHQKPTHVTLINVLPLCCTQFQGKSIHAFAVRTGLMQETLLLTSLISMYARFENEKSCLLLFEMSKKDVSLWNAIMSATVQTKNPRNTVAFFSELLQTGQRPDIITILSLISACVQLSSINLTDSVLAYALRGGFDKDLVISNSLINLYARCGTISTAEEIFEGMLAKDTVSWSVMINGYGLHGDGEAALNLLGQMELSGMIPDDITYLNVLSACSHAGLVEQGWKIFESMAGHGVVPRIEHYACMVDLLGRTGHLDQAYEVVKVLPCKPSKGLLESLLGACRIHGNVELGEKISRMLFDMNPEDSGTYVMLHNIYADAGRWIDAERIRSDMEARQLSKAAGFSQFVGNGHLDIW